MSTTTEVTQKDLHDLLNIFGKKPFVAGSCEEGTLEAEIMKKCEWLFKKDYALIELDNPNGVLSSRYPGRIFIPEYEHGHTASNANNCSSNTISTENSNIPAFSTLDNPAMQQNQQQQVPQQPQYPSPRFQQFLNNQHIMQVMQSTNVTTGMGNTATNTIYEDLYDVGKIRDLITMAKYARCRQRFVVPVMMYRGKYICRSSTISINVEAYGRKVVDYAYDYLTRTNSSDRGSHTVDDENNENEEDSLVTHVPSHFSYEEVIKSDVQLLRALNVRTIVDLMVENRKVKYFVTVSSSEKAHPETHYQNFNLLALPYPGCEFFTQFRDNNYMAKNLCYDWEQSFNDAIISVPKSNVATELNINWNEYREWDLVLMTQNYLKICLKYIKDAESGLLIHCISGWDRTPLFISLVRLSLWADGLIHQSLNAQQITYFTLAYDWYLFGHQLPNRLKKGEDILFFCFHFLKHITDDEFSIVEHRKRTKTSSSSGNSSCSATKSESCDEDPLKEDLLILGYDQDSNESFSNSSICDMSIIDNFFSTTTTTQPNPPNTTSVSCNPLTNRSPNSKRSRTSPITVPGSRQRLESTSSIGSWQVVNETGSIESTTNESYLNRCRSQQDADSHTSCNSDCDNPCNSSNASSTNAALNVNNANEVKPTVSLRKQRLSAVRAILIGSYGRTVGLKFKEGSAMNLAAVIDSLTSQLF